ncbi:hypothetical protein ADL22_29285 [Streptomyces sp. NRRL F-4489]|nr:hypothetical protein ADL22_29285 [Streptomyces sp. NRRL F-4489]
MSVPIGEGLCPGRVPGAFRVAHAGGEDLVDHAFLRWVLEAVQELADHLKIARSAGSHVGVMSDAARRRGP